MKQILILRGLPYSGKTTWANKVKQKEGKAIAIFDVDEARLELADIEDKIAERWDIVLKQLEGIILGNNNIIIDGTNILSSSYRRILETITKIANDTEESYMLSIKDFKTPVWICEKRAKSSNDEVALRKIKFLYDHCLRRKTIYRDEKNSKANL